MRTLKIEELEIVGGAADWGEVGTGLGAVALGVAIAATPVGIIGATGAAMLSLAGGYWIGSGLQENQSEDGD